MQIEDSYPLSPVQHGMVIHSLSAPESGVYVQQLACALHEDLNISAFRRAWQRIINRHPILRTSIIWNGLAEPLQQVHRDVRLPFEYRDWSYLPPDRQEELLEGFIQSDRQRGFNFNEAPLMRLALFRRSQDDYQLIWTSHHALLDGRSRLLVLKELFAFYEAFCGSQNLRLKKPQPYRHYIDWLGKKDFAEAEGFWRSMLSGLGASTPLAVDHSGTVQHGIQRFGRQTGQLSERVTSDLRFLAERHQLTPNTFLQGAWALLLSRYSGEGNVVFGATRAGRHAPVEGVESIAGLLINTVPVRVRVSSESPLLPWLNELRDQWVAMRDFEHTPLVRIQSLTDVPAGKPLFESILVFENYQLNSALREQGREWEKREFQLIGTTNYPLTVAGYLERALLLEIQYDRRRFDDATIARMLGHLRRLLEGMVADPTQRLADLPLLTEGERHQLLVEWNDTETDYPKDQCIHELFEAQVERTPDAVALVFEDQQLTYQELNYRANQLARYLRTLGVGPEVLVGIFIDRSLEMVIGVLGILKAGGAYVPLDPIYPKERLAFMLEDTQAPVLLTQERLVKGLPKHSARIVRIDSKWEIVGWGSEVAPISSAQPDNLAYMIYTSGSTGKPKGVQVLHRAVLNFLNSMRKQPGLTEKDILVAVTTLSFDIAGLELFLPLSVGARVVLAGSQVAADGSRLAEVLATSGATLMQATPSTWRLLMEAGWQTPDHFKVLCGGESLPRDLADHLLDRAYSVWNMYGPTETTIWSATQRVESGGSVIPVGRPIDNTQIYILDPYLNPVPVGVPGELYIGGVGLARGYRNHPELVAEKFIPNPFSAGAADRLYKTGDRARYLPDGKIEFLGRTDDQAKIRGFRIELGEIETVLSQHPGVSRVIVIERAVAGDKRLIGYVVPKEEYVPSSGELRDFLSKKFPEYMVPAGFVFLDSLPLTPNGKVDRRTLPAPDQTKVTLENYFVAPRDALELQLVRTWEKVLGTEPIGVKDNFFDLGGHSLLAVRLFAQIEKIMGKNLPLAALFQGPTVEQLARLISQQEWSAPWKSLVAVQPGGSRPPFFCVHAHDGSVLFWRDLARHLGSDQPFYGLQAQGLDGRQAPHSRIEEMAAYYIKEMRALQPEGPYFIGGHCIGGLIAFEMAQQLHAQGERVGLLALFDSYAPRRQKSVPNFFFYRYRYKAIRFFQTVNLHVSNLLILGPRERLPYIKAKLDKALYKLYMGIGSPWVRAARNRRKILNVGTQAARSYNPEVYPGRVTLFRATNLPRVFNHDPQMGWGRLAGGGLEAHLIPGYHAHIVLEPRVRLLAKQLRGCLIKAGADEPSKKTSVPDRTKTRSPSSLNNNPLLIQSRDSTPGSAHIPQ